MSDYLKKVPWNAVSSVVTLIIATSMLVLTLSLRASNAETENKISEKLKAYLTTEQAVTIIKNALSEELKLYVSKDEFRSWKESHAEWGEEVIGGLRKDIVRMETTVNNIDRKMDNLQQRPPPMRPPMQQPRESNGN